MAANAEREVEDLKAEFNDLKSDVSRLADTVKKMSSDKTVEGREHVRRTAERSRERARQSVDALENGIGERPLTSIATAFGIGFIIGKLLDR